MNKLKKIIEILFLFMFALVLTKCTDVEDNIDDVSKFEITKIEPTSSYRGGVIKISGSNFGNPAESSFVLLGDSVIRSMDCLSWKTFEIILRAYSDSVTNNVRVVVNNDTTNGIIVSLSYLPEYEFASVGTGKFIMGSEFGIYDERPIREVSITKSLEVGKYEVTNLLWNLVNNYPLGDVESDNYPIEEKSWEQVILFCNEYSKLNKLDTCYIISNVRTEVDSISGVEEIKFDVEYNNSANGWRLPTEAEWEYFAKAGTNTDYYDDDYNAIAWYGNNSGIKSHSVGQKTANQFGIYDALGNVSEWCWDYYSANYYAENNNIDPLGPTIGNARVIRGGYYGSGISDIRSSKRLKPISNYKGTGFRLVKNGE